VRGVDSWIVGDEIILTDTTKKNLQDLKNDIHGSRADYDRCIIARL